MRKVKLFNSILVIGVSILLMNCNKSNILTGNPSEEFKEFTIAKDSVAKVVFKISRRSSGDLTSNVGEEMLYFSVRSIQGILDSANFEAIVYKNNSKIYIDTFKLINLSNEIVIDSIKLNDFLSDINAYSAVCKIIGSKIDINGLYEGFVKISNDTVEYYKPFSSVIQNENKIQTTISGDTLNGFNASFFQDSLLVGDFIFKSDTISIDYKHTNYKLSNKSLSMKLDFTSLADTNYNKFKLEFNATKK